MIMCNNDISKFAIWRQWRNNYSRKASYILLIVRNNNKWTFRSPGPLSTLEMNNTLINQYNTSGRVSPDLFCWRIDSCEGSSVINQAESSSSLVLKASGFQVQSILLWYQFWNSHSLKLQTSTFSSRTQFQYPSRPAPF